MLAFGRGAADQQLLRAVYAGGHNWLVDVAWGLTQIGYAAPLIAITVVACAWLWLSGRHHAILAVVAIIVSGRAIVEAQKLLIREPRPALLPHLVATSSFSFPSAHAADSMLVFVTIAAIVPPRRWRRAAVIGAVALSFLIGSSRVLLSVHWPSDVIAGWSFGAFWVVLGLWIASARRFDVRR